MSSNVVVNLYRSMRSIDKCGLNGAIKYFLSNYSKYIFMIRVGASKHKLFLRGKTSDVKVFYEVVILNEYPYIDEDFDLIIDAGANVGYATWVFSERYPNAQIVAIEPENSNMELLKRNTESLGNIKCIKKGLWSHKTVLSVADDQVDKYSFRLIDKKIGRGIETITLNDILNEYPDKNKVLVKMDIEGAEAEVFNNNEWVNKITYIMIEPHDTLKEIFNSLVEYDYHGRLSRENIILQIKK